MLLQKILFAAFIHSKTFHDKQTLVILEFTKFYYVCTYNVQKNTILNQNKGTIEPYQIDTILKIQQSSI